MTGSDTPSVLIHIYGRTTVGVEALAAIFQMHGCPRDLSYRVAADVRTYESRRTRVLPHVDIAGLNRDLAQYGITVEKLEG